LVIASQVTGFISFFFTLLTWLGVYVSLLITLRSAPTQIPLILSNLREEMQEERSMLRQRLKEGDRYHVFRGREMRKVGSSESHIRLLETTLRILWKEFRGLEGRFLVSPVGGEDVEDGRGDASGSGDSDAPGDEGRRANGYDEKGGKVRNRGRMRRRESHMTSWMGMREAGLSIDRSTYYNTDLRHRILWWWKGDEVRALADRVQRLQMRRIERDVYECDELVKRGLAIMGGMGGEDVYNDCGEGGPNGGRGGGGVRRRKRRSAKSSRAPSFSASQRSRNVSRAGVREVYEKEIRRVKRRDSSPSSRSVSPSTSSPARVAGSTVSMSRRREPVSRSRAPSVVEYEVVNPGRVWVDVEDSTRPTSNIGRDSNVSRRVSRPPPAHYQSYVRQRGSEHSPHRSRRD